LAGKIHLPYLLQREHALEMRACAKGSPIDFGHPELRIRRGKNDIGRAANADAAAEHIAVRRCDDRLQPAMDGAKRLVVSGIHLEDPLRMLLPFLDIDARAEAAPLGANDDGAHRIIRIERVDGLRKPPPAFGIQGIDRRVFDDELGNAGFDFRPELIAHGVLHQFAGIVPSLASASSRSSASLTMRATSSSQLSSLSIVAATWPLGRRPLSGSPATMPRCTSSGRLLAITVCAKLLSSA